MTSPVLLRASSTALGVQRRRMTIGMLVFMPLAFYVVTHDSVGQSVRSLTFGISWAVSTVAFFAATSAREVEPRLVLAGWRPLHLIAGRLLGLIAVVVGLTVLFGLLVSVDRDPQNLWAVWVDFAVTGVVAVAVGTAVGALLSKELEGTLVLFLLAGLQAIVNPFETYSMALPFWSSRELGTYAIDGPAEGSLVDGLLHAAVVLALCAVVVGVAGRLRSQR